MSRMLLRGQRPELGQEIPTEAKGIFIVKEPSPETRVVYLSGDQDLSRKVFDSEEVRSVERAFGAIDLGFSKLRNNFYMGRMGLRSENLLLRQGVDQALTRFGVIGESRIVVIDGFDTRIIRPNPPPIPEDVIIEFPTRFRESGRVVVFRTTDKDIATNTILGIIRINTGIKSIEEIGLFSGFNTLKNEFFIDAPTGLLSANIGPARRQIFQGIILALGDTVDIIQEGEALVVKRKPGIEAFILIPLIGIGGIIGLGFLARSIFGIK